MSTDTFTKVWTAGKVWRATLFRFRIDQFFQFDEGLFLDKCRVCLLFPVFRVRDIFGRIWIPGPVSLSLSESCSFRQWPSRCQPKVFAHCFFKVHLPHSSLIKSHKEVTKQWKARFFLLFLLDVERILIWIRIRTSAKGSRSGRPKKLKNRTGTLKISWRKFFCYAAHIVKNGGQTSHPEVALKKNHSLAKHYKNYCTLFI